MSDEKLLRWKDLDGVQKYKVVELARQSGISMTDLCKRFGVTRQTLYRAMETVDKAALEALTAKRPGRPAISPVQKEIADLQAVNKQLESDLKRERLKNQVAQAMLDIQQKTERQLRMARGKKKRSAPRTKLTSGTDGTQPGS